MNFKWGMRFNPKKCNIMQVARSNPLTKIYEMCDEALICATDARYLGVSISNDLQWEKHINNVARKANNTLNFLRRNLRYCPRDVKSTAYFSLVRSTMDYAASCWDPYLQKDKDKLEQINRRAARFVGNIPRSDRTTSVTSLMKDMQWNTLEKRRQNQRMCMMYKISHQLVAVPPTQLIPPNRRTRSNHCYKYQTIRANTTVYKNSFYPRSIPEWNDLSADLAESPSLDTFKSRLAKSAP